MEIQDFSRVVNYWGKGVDIGGGQKNIGGGSLLGNYGCVAYFSQA